MGVYIYTHMRARVMGAHEGEMGTKFERRNPSILHCIKRYMQLSTCDAIISKGSNLLVIDVERLEANINDTNTCMCIFMYMVLPMI